MSFYKLDSDVLLSAKEQVINANYELYAAQREAYEYPIDGWYWFDSRQDALAFFNVDPDLPE